MRASCAEHVDQWFQGGRFFFDGTYKHHYHDNNEYDNIRSDRNRNLHGRDVAAFLLSRRQFNLQAVEFTASTSQSLIDTSSTNYSVSLSIMVSLSMMIFV